MKHGRQFIMIFLVVLLFVVFYISCGEPSFFNVSSDDVVIEKIDTSDDSSIQFTVQCNDDEEVSKIDNNNGPGLILSYVILDTDEDGVLIANLSTEGNSSYNTLVNGFKKSVIDAKFLSIGANNSILDFEVESKTYSLMSFEVNGSRAESPIYHLHLPKTSSAVNLTYTLQQNYSQTEAFFKFSNSGNTYKIKANQIPGKTVLIYASYTPGMGKFSDNFFSSLKYVGSIVIPR